MREICFKAKRKDNGEWVYGYYMDRHGCEIIEKGTWLIFDVDEKTICQYTGLTDKNGNKIWENDVARDSRGNIYKAFWQERYYQFSWMCIKSDLLPIGAKWDLWSLAKNNDLEVIGTTFDNPELMKGE